MRSGASPLPQPSRLPSVRAGASNGDVAPFGGGHFLCRRPHRVRPSSYQPLRQTKGLHKRQRNLFEPGGGGADSAVTNVSLVIRTHACNQKKWASARAPAPSAGLSSRQKPCACSLRRQVPGVPQVQNLTQPQVEEKDCEASPTSPPTPSEEGRRNLFHLLGVGCTRSGILCKDAPGRVFLVSRDSFNPHYHLHRRMTRSDKLPFTTTITNHGLRQRVKTYGEK